MKSLVIVSVLVVAAAGVGFVAGMHHTSPDLDKITVTYRDGEDYFSSIYEVSRQESKSPGRDLKEIDASARQLLNEFDNFERALATPGVNTLELCKGDECRVVHLQRVAG